MRKYFFITILETAGYIGQLLSPRSKSSVLKKDLSRGYGRTTLRIYHRGNVLKDHIQLRFLPVRCCEQAPTSFRLLLGKPMWIPVFIVQKVIKLLCAIIHCRFDYRWSLECHLCPLTWLVRGVSDQQKEISTNTFKLLIPPNVAFQDSTNPSFSWYTALGKLRVATFK